MRRLPGERRGTLFVRLGAVRRAHMRHGSGRTSGPLFRDVRVVRAIVAVMALVLGAYCLIVAVTALSAQPAPGHPDPGELASRERYRWPGWIPITFLVLVVLYAVMIAARRRRRGPRGRRIPSTQDPPTPDQEPRRPYDMSSRE